MGLGPGTDLTEGVGGGGNTVWRGLKVIRTVSQQARFSDKASSAAASLGNVTIGIKASHLCQTSISLFVWFF